MQQDLFRKVRLKCNGKFPLGIWEGRKKGHLISCLPRALNGKYLPWFICWLGSEDKQSHKLISLFFFPNFPLFWPSSPWGFCSIHNLSGLLDPPSTSTEREASLSDYSCIWAVQWSINLRLEIFLFFSQVKAYFSPFGFVFALLSIVNQHNADEWNLCWFQDCTYHQINDSPRENARTLLPPVCILASGNDIYPAHWNVTLRTESYKLLLCS